MVSDKADSVSNYYRNTLHDQHQVFKDTFPFFSMYSFRAGLLMEID